MLERRAHLGELGAWLIALVTAAIAVVEAQFRFAECQLSRQVMKSTDLTIGCPATAEQREQLAAHTLPRRSNFAIIGGRDHAGIDLIAQFEFDPVSFVTPCQHCHRQNNQHTARLYYPREEQSGKLKLYRIVVQCMK